MLIDKWDTGIAMKRLESSGISGNIGGENVSRGIWMGDKEGLLDWAFIRGCGVRCSIDMKDRG
jgi:hypothetical protein